MQHNTFQHVASNSYKLVKLKTVSFAEAMCFDSMIVTLHFCPKCNRTEVFMK